MEIYNETIKDLLGSGDPNAKHEIKLVNPNSTGSACEVTVTNVKTVTVASETQVGQDDLVACDMGSLLPLSLYVFNGQTSVWDC